MTLRQRIGILATFASLFAATPAMADTTLGGTSPDEAYVFTGNNAVGPGVVQPARASSGAVVSAPVKLGGLTCFSITPPKWDSPSKPDQWPTCDKLCAAQEAVCTGMQNGGINPPMTCSDPISSPFLGVCRCCKATP